uniref:L1 transposable element RRM domain-containing protein n=1 Tax=Latimeria chalumnae TaxID=7897 RepID=H2ZUV7_LATCH
MAEQGISSATSTTLWEDKSEGMSRDIKNIYVLLQKVAGDIESLKENVQNLESGMRDLGKKLETALMKVDNLENRSRRNNIRIVGFPENVEGNPITFLTKKIPELLGLESGLDLEIECAHHTLAPRPAPGQRPRAFIIRFLKFQTKELILRAARSKGTIRWKGNGIHFFPDLSRDLQSRRQWFAGVHRWLREKGIQYGMFYPAVLKITFNGATTAFSTPEEAEAFLS